MDRAVMRPAAIPAWRSAMVASSSANGELEKGRFAGSLSCDAPSANASAADSGLPFTAMAPAMALTRTKSLRSMSIHLN